MKTLTTSCLECGREISFTGGEVGQWKDCPGCGQRTMLSPLNAIASRNDRANYLAMLRRSSCYPALRTLIGLLTLMGVLVAIGCFALAVREFKFASWDGSPADLLNLKTGGMFLAYAAITMIATLAARELCLLLIDLTDATLEANSQRNK